ncbi:hypothetical protein K1719_026804, partial [Acacia pycnantha]
MPQSNCNIHFITHFSPLKQNLGVGRSIFVAIQTLGVVFGDVGTSPLYTFSVIFKKALIDGNEDILGALSLVLYTLILFPLLKYVLVVLWANDGGEGYDFPSPFQYNIMFGVQKRSVTMMIAGQIHVPST